MPGRKGDLAGPRGQGRGRGAKFCIQCSPKKVVCRSADQKPTVSTRCRHRGNPNPPCALVQIPSDESDRLREKVDRRLWGGEMGTSALCQPWELPSTLHSPNLEGLKLAKVGSGGGRELLNRRMRFHLNHGQHLRTQIVSIEAERRAQSTGPASCILGHAP